MFSFSNIFRVIQLEIYLYYHYLYHKTKALMYDKHPTFTLKVKENKNSSLIIQILLLIIAC